MNNGYRTLIGEEEKQLTEVISGARSALEWTTEMQDLVNKLHEQAAAVEVNTSSLSGSFVEIALKAYFNDEDPPARATLIMGEYEWDRSTLSEEGDQWVLYVKRRYSYP